jgi:hypothetical protein
VALDQRGQQGQQRPAAGRPDQIAAEQDSRFHASERSVHTAPMTTGERVVGERLGDEKPAAAPALLVVRLHAVLELRHVRRGPG